MQGNLRKKTPCFLSVFLAVSLLLACSSGFKQTIQLDQKSLTMDRLLDQSAYPDAGALFIINEGYIEVFQNEQMRFSVLKEHTVIKVFNEKGYKYANVLIPYDVNSKISNIQARTILPDGQSIPLAKDQIFDTHLYPEYIFYSDLHAKRFTMPAVENGCVLDYQWTKTVENFTFWTRWLFQQDEPVLLSKYTVRCPNTWDIRWKTYGVSIQPEVEKAMKDTKVDHVWKVENIPAFVPETDMPPGNNTVMSILFSPVGVKTWDDVAMWFRGLMKDRLHADEAIKKKTAELIRNADPPQEKLRRIFEFVRDRIRYIAIETGIGGYQPHFAGSVFSHKYGDCKDMVTLMMSMAKEAGIQVNPVLISTWHYGELDTGMVSPTHFNHLIAHAVLSDTSEIWMDPTEKACPFGDVPWYDKGRLAMIVTQEGKAIMRQTPKLKKKENVIERHWTLRVDSTGKANGSLQFIFKGIQAGEMRYFLRKRNQKDMKNWFGKEVLSRFPSSQCDTLEIQNPNDLDQPLRITGAFSNAVFSIRDNRTFSFQPASLAAYDWNHFFPEMERHHAVQLQYPLEIIDHADIWIPKEWKIASFQNQDSVLTPTGKYACKVFWDMGKLTYQRYFKMDSTAIETPHYMNFRTFLNDVAAKDKKTLFFTF